MSNVPHTLRRTAFWNLASYCLLRLPDSVFRAGPWYCVQCNQKRLFLPYHDPNAPTYRDSFEFEQQDRTKVTELCTDTTWTSAGNFIRDEKSIVRRARSLKRYSEKYRDSVVSKLARGATTLIKVRSELGLTEAEIMYWIHDRLERLVKENESLRSKLGHEIPNEIDGLLGEFFARRRSTGKPNPSNSWKLHKQLGSSKSDERDPSSTNLVVLPASHLR